MTASDRKEMFSMIELALKPLAVTIDERDKIATERDKLMNASLGVIDSHLERIDAHLSRQNGSIGTHEKAINRVIDTLGEDRLKDCIQKDTIKELRDNMITRKGITRAIITGITISSTLIGTGLALVAYLL